MFGVVECEEENRALDRLKKSAVCRAGKKTLTIFRPHVPTIVRKCCDTTFGECWLVTNSTREKFRDDAKENIFVGVKTKSKNAARLLTSICARKCEFAPLNLLDARLTTKKKRMAYSVSSSGVRRRFVRASKQSI